MRLFLGAYPLTPTFRNVGNKFSVRYYLNLVLIDEDDRRYFKQQEITLWRKEMYGLLVVLAVDVLFIARRVRHAHF